MLNHAFAKDLIMWCKPKPKRITDAQIMERLKAMNITPDIVTYHDIERAWMKIKDKRTPGWERFGTNTRTGGKVLNGLSDERLDRISDKYGADDPGSH